MDVKEIVCEIWAGLICFRIETSGSCLQGNEPKYVLIFFFCYLSDC
jgi:hypothetical protein